jgi:hypothetical protein
MLSFDNVLVTPFTELLQNGGTVPTLHRGGPDWPEFDRQTHARHCRGGVPVDHQPAPAPEELTLDGPFAWGGPVVGHFGHQIADFGTRLGPTLAAWPEAVFLHAGLHWDAIGSLVRTPEHFQHMLAWLGIPPDRVRFVDRATRVRKIFVAPQAEQLGGPGPATTYLDWLDELTAARLGRIAKEGVVYVSRAGTPARFAAETYVEDALIEAGVRVVRPETLPLEEQLRTYASARHLIFAEGSAMNGAQLLGRTLGQVTILRRRPGSEAARTALEPRSQSLHYIEPLRGLIHGVNRLGVPETWNGISVLDGRMFVEELEAIGIPLRPQWRSKDFAARRDADLREWLSARNDSAIPGSAESIEHTLRAAGLGRVADLYKQTLLTRI